MASNTVSNAQPFDDLSRAEIFGAQVLPDGTVSPVLRSIDVPGLAEVFGTGVTARVLDEAGDPYLDADGRPQLVLVSAETGEIDRVTIGGGDGASLTRTALDDNGDGTVTLRLYATPPGGAELLVGEHTYGVTVGGTAIAKLSAQEAAFFGAGGGQPDNVYPTPFFGGLTAADFALTTGALSPGNPYDPSGQTVAGATRAYVRVDVSALAGQTASYALGAVASGTASTFRVRAVFYDDGDQAVGTAVRSLGYSPFGAAGAEEVRRLQAASAVNGSVAVPAGASYALVGIERDEGGDLSDTYELTWAVVVPGETVTAAVPTPGTPSVPERVDALEGPGEVGVWFDEGQSNAARIGSPDGTDLLPVSAGHLLLDSTDPDDDLATIGAASLVPYDDALRPQTTAGGPDGVSSAPGFLEACWGRLGRRVVVATTARSNTSVTVSGVQNAGDPNLDTEANQAGGSVSLRPRLLARIRRGREGMDRLGLTARWAVLSLEIGGRNAQAAEDAGAPGSAAYEAEVAAYYASYLSLLQEAAAELEAAFPGRWVVVGCRTVVHKNEDPHDGASKPGWKRVRSAPDLGALVGPSAPCHPHEHTGRLGGLADNVHPLRAHCYARGRRIYDAARPHID